MPLQKINLRPGVSRESTTLANEGGWFSCDKVRFRSGQPENIGGWVPVGVGSFLGVCRDLIEWSTLSSPISYLLLGVGTNLKYYVLSNQTYYDITPIKTTLAPATTGTNPFLPIFTTLNGSITATTDTIVVTSGATMAYTVPLVITIDSELIYVQNVSGTTLTGCIRGYGGTTAASHSGGVNVASTWINVYAPSNNAIVGDFVTISGATNFGPYSVANLNQNFQVLSESGNYIAVDVGILSTSSSVGGGTAVTETFEITTGATGASSGSGWGAGTWVSLVYNAGLNTLASDLAAGATSVVLVDGSSFPSSGYIMVEAELIQYAGKSSNTLTSCTRGVDGTGNTYHGAGQTVRAVSYVAASRAWNVPASTAISVNIPLRLWSSDVFGQDLVFNVRDNAIYYWTPSSGGMTSTGAIATRGVNITTLSGADGWSPVIATRVLVTEERHIVVLGANDPTVGNAQDPLLVRWCEQENPTIWLPTETNTAGFQRLSYGSKLITSEKTRQEVLIWTDSALYSMRYLGPPYIFGFNIMATDTSIASPNAAVTANNVTYWMGHDKFYAYSGRVDTLPCALRQYIFSDINKLQLEQTYAGRNEKFNEVWWLYCSAASTSPDRYVLYNYLENTWCYGTLARSVWLDSQVRAYPLAAGLDGKVYLHDYGTDDGSTNPPSAIAAYVESADFDIGDGDSFAFIQRVIPDIDFIGSSISNPAVDITLYVRNFPGQGNDTASTASTISGSSVSLQVYDYTKDAWVRLRGRQASMRIASQTAGTKWQLGSPRLLIQPDGRKT